MTMSCNEMIQACSDMKRNRTYLEHVATHLLRTLQTLTASLASVGKAPANVPDFNDASQMDMAELIRLEEYIESILSHFTPQMENQSPQVLDNIVHKYGLPPMSNKR